MLVDFGSGRMARSTPEAWKWYAEHEAVTESYLGVAGDAGFFSTELKRRGGGPEPTLW